MSVNLRVCASVVKAESVAFRTPTQPHPKDLCSNEAVIFSLNKGINKMYLLLFFFFHLNESTGTTAQKHL